MKLINKSALVAEIDKIKEMYCYDTKTNASFVAEAVINSINNAIDTLEVKEVDLEKEIQEVHKHFHDYYGIVNSDTNEFAKVDDIIHIAKHFFELGMAVSNKAQKEK